MGRRTRNGSGRFGSAHDERVALVPEGSAPPTISDDDPFIPSILPRAPPPTHPSRLPLHRPALPGLLPKGEGAGRRRGTTWVIDQRRSPCPSSTDWLRTPHPMPTSKAGACGPIYEGGGRGGEGGGRTSLSAAPHQPPGLPILRTFLDPPYGDAGSSPAVQAVIARDDRKGRRPTGPHARSRRALSIARSLSPAGSLGGQAPDSSPIMSFPPLARGSRGWPQDR